jgi:hypothetical protein
VVLTTIPEDQQAKYLFFGKVATEVQRLGAVGIVNIADTWTLPRGIELPPGKRPGDMEERQEALLVTGVRNDGAIRTLIAPYGRVDDEPQFEDTLDAGPSAHYFLAPVLRVWGLAAPSEADDFEGEPEPRVGTNC